VDRPVARSNNPWWLPIVLGGFLTAVPAFAASAPSGTGQPDVRTARPDSDDPDDTDEEPEDKDEDGEQLEQDDIVPIDMDIEEINRRRGYDTFSEHDLKFKKATTYKPVVAYAYDGKEPRLGFTFGALGYTSVYSGNLNMVPVEIRQLHYVPYLGLGLDYDLLDLTSLSTLLLVELNGRFGQHYYNLALPMVTFSNMGIKYLGLEGALKVRFVFGTRLKDFLELFAAFERLSLTEQGASRLAKSPLQTVPPIRGLLVSSTTDLGKVGGAFALSVTETFVLNLKGGLLVFSQYHESPVGLSGLDPTTSGFFGETGMMVKFSATFSIELAARYTQLSTEFGRPSGISGVLRSNVLAPKFEHRYLQGGLTCNYHF